MSKDLIVALAGCIVLSLAIFIGSTGFGYTIYRPLRYYDIFSLVIAWAGLAFYIWKHKKGSKP